MTATPNLVTKLAIGNSNSSC